MNDMRATLLSVLCGSAAGVVVSALYATLLWALAINLNNLMWAFSIAVLSSLSGYLLAGIFYDEIVKRT